MTRYPFQVILIRTFFILIIVAFIMRILKNETAVIFKKQILTSQMKSLHMKKYSCYVGHVGTPFQVKKISKF